MGESVERAAKLAYFIVGAGIGAVVALLFAPRPGRETRDIIAQRAADSRERVASATRTTSGKVSGYVDKGKEVVSTQKDQIAAAIEAGKQAYQEDKSKTEREAE